MRSMKIAAAACEFILGVSANLYPKEFTAQLRIEDDAITEVLIIPASTFGKGFAVTRLDMVPIDHSIDGTVHSHPGASFLPSKADLKEFRKRGNIHLIARYPYHGLDDIAAYSGAGEEVALEVVE